MVRKICRNKGLKIKSMDLKETCFNVLFQFFKLCFDGSVLFISIFCFDVLFRLFRMKSAIGPCTILLIFSALPDKTT